MELRFGWLVPPLMAAIAPSATSTPASAAFKDGGRVDAAGVVRVKVDRNADFLPQRFTNSNAA